MNGNTALYIGKVMHARQRPRKHALTYRVFSLLLDLDELPRHSATMRLFGYNRSALFSFWDKDHGDGREGGLGDWVKRQLLKAGIEGDDLRIRILCYPRILGYVFNPLTVYFCYAPDGGLRAILYEVCNTFHERHTYVIPVDEGTPGTVRQSCAKELYVSPFIEMECSYNFRIVPPDERVLIAINETDAQGPLLVATFTGSRREFSDWQLFKTFFQYPLMTLKVMAGIHWEALRLWAKGVPVYPHKPASSPVGSTIIKSKNQLDETSHEPC